MEIAFKVLSTYYPFFNDQMLAKPIANLILPCLTAEQITFLLYQCTQVLSKDPTFLRLDGRYFIVGDLHGNIIDLIRILKYIGLPTKDKKIIFLGDYIDRGEFSLEVMVLLVSLKLLFPSYIYLLRGNHEFPSVNVLYGFRDQICRAYSMEVYDLFNSLFANLPICAVIGNHTFCVHGGISEKLHTLSQLDEIKKPQIEFTDSQHGELVMDLVWSDPSLLYQYFGPQNRGSGHFFGEKAMLEFLTSNGLTRIVRGHQFVVKGVEQFASNLYTVFSTSRYKPEIENKSGIVEVSAIGTITAYSFPQNIPFPRSGAHFTLITNIKIPVDLVKFSDKESKKPNNSQNYTQNNTVVSKASSASFIPPLKGTIETNTHGTLGGSAVRLTRIRGSYSLKAQLCISRKSQLY